MRARWILSLLLLFALAIPALAQDRRGASSLDRVLPHVRQTVPGTFYDAEGPFPGQDGRMSYRLKWMTPDGRIIWFSVDAQSGQVIGGAPRGLSSSGRGRDDGASQGSWGAPRNNWRQNDDGRGGQGYGQGGWGSDRGNGWGNGRDNGRDNGHGSGWGNGRDNDRDNDRGNGWGNNRDNGGRDNNWGNRGGGRDNDHSGDRGNGWGNGGSRDSGGGRGSSWGGGGSGRGGDSGSGGRRHPGGG